MADDESDGPEFVPGPAFPPSNFDGERFVRDMLELPKIAAAREAEKRRLDAEALAAALRSQSIGINEQSAAIPARTADSGADRKRKTRALVPANPDVAKLAKKLQRELKPGETKIEIARDFTNGDTAKAKNLLRQVNRWKLL